MHLRILMLAYGYGETDISEAYTSWNIAREVSMKHSVTVMTRDQVDETNGPPSVVRIRPGRSFWSERLRRALKPDYFSFNYRAWRLVKSGAVGNFDICHHVSPISYRYPDLLATLQTPFIWGPVGGSLTYPNGFQYLSKGEPAAYRLRGIDFLRFQLDPLLRRTMDGSLAIVATSRDAAALLPEKYKDRAVVIGEGIAPATPREDPQLTSGVHGDYIFCSGRLVPSKGIEFLLRAFAKTKIPKLLITGDGPSRKCLLKLRGKLHIEDRVQFLGAVSKEQNLALMSRSQFCVFPSLKEAFGHVNLEAMMCGKPVIAVAYGGPRDIIVEGVTGILIEPRDPEFLVNELAKSMEVLHMNKERRDQMGQAGFRRAKEQFSWARIGQRYLKLYETVLLGSSLSEGA